MNSDDKMAEWRLYYWHFLPGRGEYVRLMFEEAGVPYDDVCRREDNSESALKFYTGERDGFPVLAPPVVQKGEFVLSQTPAILQHLGKELGLYPEGGPEEEAHAMQVCVADRHAPPLRNTGLACRYCSLVKLIVVLRRIANVFDVATKTGSQGVLCFGC